MINQNQSVIAMVPGLPGKTYRIGLLFWISCWMFLPTSLAQFSFSAEDLIKSKNSNLNPIEFLAEIIPKKILQNELLTLKIWGRVIEGYHVYSIYSQGQFAPEPTQLLVNSSFLISVSDLTESKAVSVMDETFNEKLNVHRHDFWLEQRFRLKKNVSPGIYSVEGSLQYQICNNRICSLPIIKPFQVQFEVSGN